MHNIVAWLKFCVYLHVCVCADSCKKTAVVFEDLVSSLEFVNCQSMQGQVRHPPSPFILFPGFKGHFDLNTSKI